MNKKFSMKEAVTAVEYLSSWSNKALLDTITKNACKGVLPKINYIIEGRQYAVKSWKNKASEDETENQSLSTFLSLILSFLVCRFRAVDINNLFFASIKFQTRGATSK